MISQTYDLNLIPSQIPVTIHCSQYDDGSRTFVFNLYEGASAFEIPAGASATFSGVKPDGLGFQYACAITGASQVSVDVALQMTAVAGDCPCKVTVYDTDSNVLGSALCVLDVERHPLQDDTVISDSDFPIIQEVANFAEHFQPSDFVATNQGVSQAGKVLGVGDNGMVIPVQGGGSIDAEDVSYWKPNYDNVSDALDALFDIKDTAYIIDGYLDTTMDSADKIPYFDVSTPQRKNITLGNFVSTIAPNFGSRLATTQGYALDLLDKDGNLLDSVDMQTTANRVSYTDTHSVGVANIQSAMDKVFMDSESTYKISDTTDTTISSADFIPFVTTPANSKKKITFGNFVTTLKTSLANYFGRKLSQSNGKLSLLSDNNTVLDTVTLSPLATNTSYTDTNSIGATNVQSAVDKLGSFSTGTLTVNSAYASGNASYQKYGKVVIVYLSDVIFKAQPASGSWSVAFVSGLPKMATILTNPKILLMPFSNAYAAPVRLAFNSGATALYFHWTNQNVQLNNVDYNLTFAYICE